MSDDLLAHYNRELLSIRRSAAAFAAEHPRIAGRLRLSEDSIEDPHVGRLIEAFAYLTARIRQKLDDDFPELTESLLGILYPHYQRPIPSMAIAQLQPQPDLPAMHRQGAGAVLETEAVDGERCRFRTAYDTQLHPLAIKAASLGGRPILAPPAAAAVGAVSCLRLTLEAFAPDMRFDEMAPESLRFFLRGQPQLVFPLYELLLNDVLAVAFAGGPEDTAPVILGPQALSPVGFEPDQGLLPYPKNAHIGFRLLTEYFSFPEKFLFVDLAFPERARLAGRGRTLEVFVYLKRSVPTLERSLNERVFALGCTPIVNLFPQRAEPIAWDHTQTEYRIVPDSRRVQALEVYSIEKVVASDTDGNARDVLPFYDIRHGLDTDGGGAAWWLAKREAASSDNPGSEIFLSLVDPAFQPSAAAGHVLSVDALCFNRNLPERLPFGGGHPTLRFLDPAPAIDAVHCLTAPTATLRPEFGQGNRWRLISHLALNHLSIVQDGRADALREILLLYDVRGSAETRALIDGIVGVSAKAGSARVKGRGGAAFCRGVDVTVTLDEPNFSGSGLFLMASVLERFLGLYASVNSFSRLTATVKGRTGVLRTWPARAGDRILL